MCEYLKFKEHGVTFRSENLKFKEHGVKHLWVKIRSSRNMVSKIYG